MSEPPLFWALTLGGCGYSAAAGGRDGSWAALFIFAASLMTIPAERFGDRWISTEFGVMLVDLGLFACLYVLSLRTDRYFPIWMTGFQLASVASHFSTIIAPSFTPRIYRALESVWAIPITLSMVLGIALDRRAGLRRPSGGSAPTDRPSRGL